MGLLGLGDGLLALLTQTLAQGLAEALVVRGTGALLGDRVVVPDLLVVVAVPALDLDPLGPVLGLPAPLVGLEVLLAHPHHDRSDPGPHEFHGIDVVGVTEGDHVGGVVGDVDRDIVLQRDHGEQVDQVAVDLLAPLTDGDRAVGQYGLGLLVRVMRRRLSQTDLVKGGEFLGLGEVGLCLFLGAGVLCLGQQFGDALKHRYLLGLVSTLYQHGLTGCPVRSSRRLLLLLGGRDLEQVVGGLLGVTGGLVEDLRTLLAL